MEKDKLRSIAIPAIGTGAQHFPRPEVAKIFFEEVTGHFIARRQIDEVHFVVFDQATVDAFLGAVQQIKSVILSLPSKCAPVPSPKSKVIPNAGSPNNVTFTEKLDESLELSLGTTNLTEAYFTPWVVTRLKPPIIERKFHKFNLSTSSREYQNVETAFHKSVSNQIVRIEKIQNKEIYELYNVKRRAMMNKFGSNFAGKELWLFHGTSLQSIDKINANGLNRSYAGTHATSYGKGVYFARDASYSCKLKYSPPDWRGLRYMYYAKVLVGDYTQGNSSMIARPSIKDTAYPDETYDSVVDNISHPNIYVLFQDYEYYTEYLITFR
ncbi:poly [ADP-ribose] polymerase 14-like [Paramuricea clavata]|uniref:Poly [ADP-ribose] polymerase 14-like n=1 Tax=Paramuricea clavata TaxID=317549 RepID=A0A7D9I2M7_PARCT|nr:poly [ADP-ribose] polymerase 14-like [Paramuricea clavata]